jgi:hypothetical protein
MRPNRARIRKQRFAVHVLSVALEQAKAVATQYVSEASKFVVVALGGPLVDTEKEVAVIAAQHCSGQRDAWTFYLRPRPIANGANRKV